jgi:two-component system LytT family response regulator
MNLPTIEKYRTIIADDELPARTRLKDLLSVHSDKIEIVGEAVNGIQCKELIASLKPDLIFLDIQMPGLNGFEVLQQSSHAPIVIFCTAYDEYALEAFETNSVDYIVKPIKAERILKAIEKLESLRQHSSKKEVLEIINSFAQLAPKKEITTLPVKLGDRMLFIQIEDVSYFSAEEKYVAIFTRHGKKYICDYSLKDMEEKLGEMFIRIQRSLLVNVASILEINKHYNSRYVIKLNDQNQSKLISGRNYSEQIKHLLEI